jgi:minimal PKS acyl carrier protein
MAQFTIGDLTSALLEAAGCDQGVDFDDILDVPFEDLGYDSLALFNTVNKIERDCRITLPDDIVVEATTPRVMLDMINMNLSTVG